MSSRQPSNVLKSIGDCYNFDEPKDPKAKTSRRPRLGSSSAKSKPVTTSGAKETEKRDYKWRCDLIKDSLSAAVWLKDTRAESRTAIDSVLESLSNHLLSKCLCVNLCSVYLLIANTYFEQFLFRQREFETKVIAEEDNEKKSNLNDEADRGDKTAHNEIPVNKDSKLEVNIFPDLVHQKNLSDLLEPLNQAVDNWKQALELNLERNYLNQETVLGFRVQGQLSSVVQIYAFYDQMDKRLRAAELLAKYCHYFNTKYSELNLTANYYLVKTYLDLGAVAKANRCLVRLPLPSNQTELPMPETYGKSLNLLAKCEIDLMNGKVKKASKTVKSFLESPYLQKLTINRYYVKALCLLMATKFAANEFEHSYCLREFMEPLQMCWSIMKRWLPWLSTTVGKPNNENRVINIGDVDPIWYKYTVMNFAYESIQTSGLFYTHIEMPIDAIYFYNSLLKLGRRHCATYRIARLLIDACRLDIVCDHSHSAQVKLENALLCLQSERWSSGSSVFSSRSSDSPNYTRNKSSINEERGRTNKSAEDSDSEIEIIEVINNSSNDYESRECQHLHSVNVFETKRKLRASTYAVDLDQSMQYTARKESQLSLTSELCNKPVSFDAFLTRVQIAFYKILLNETDPKRVLDQTKNILHNSVEKFAKVLKNRIESLLAETVSEEMAHNYPYYKTLRLYLLEAIIECQVESREFAEAVNTCHQVMASLSLTYEQRAIEANLLYLEAYSRLEMYKNNHNLNDKKFWVEYDMKLMNNLTDILCPTQSTTPTRSTSQSKIVPKAPKAKHYKNSETEDYVKALEKNVYEERIHHKNSKSMFDWDSQLRSVPDSESNPVTNEVPMSSGDAISCKAKVHPLQRLTRSKTGLKILDPLVDSSKPKPERGSKRSSKKSEYLTEKRFVAIDEDIDQLDDVFEKVLTIEDKCDDKRKFGTESENSLELITELLNQSFQLIASHPTSKLYISAHKLLAEVYSLSENPNEQLIAYHFSESIRCTYRYRILLLNERKQRLNRSAKYESKAFAFASTDIGANNSSQTVIQDLPTNWRVVQITAVKSDCDSKIPDLTICRYQNGKRPVFLRIKSDTQKIIKHFMDHFSELIERSNASIVNKDRETFWKLRYALDEELKILLRSVDETWFGPFRGILFGQLESPDYLNMCSHLKAYALDLASKENLVCLSEPLLEVIVESLPALKFIEYRAAVKMLFKKPSDRLITNLFEKYEELISDVYPIDNKESLFTTYPLSPVGLILDTSLESFPFESLPSVHAYNQSVFRIPSLRMLSHMYDAYKSDLVRHGVDDSKVYYVVNPADNLAKTQDYFKQTFASMDLWEGVVGKVPDPTDLRNAFSSKEAYVFFGHGAGATYYRTMPDGLDGCVVNCASLVIGCSSGRMFSDGKNLESYGTAFRFLLNGCPSYVGVLWDVTDKDIDKFSDQMMSYWFAKWKPELNDSKQSLPNTKAVSKARNVCRLKHLIGAAPVVYGLPLFTRSE